MGSTEASIPYGKRLLHSTIDEIADVNPDKLCACIPRSPNLEEGFKDVTIADFARAIDRTAWWLQDLLGKSTTVGALAYIGPFDLRYFILVAASAKAEYRLFLPSLRNSHAAQLELFSKTSTEVLITTPANAAEEYLKKRPMRLLHIPELVELLRVGDVPRYKFTKTFEEAKDDPSLILHTSGSTGTPKPVFLSNQWMCAPDAAHLLPLHDGYETVVSDFTDKRILCCLPPFHSASIVLSLLNTVFRGSVSIWPPPGRPVSAPLVEDMLDAIAVDILLCAPSVLEDMSQTSESIQKLAKLKAVHCGGAPLSHDAGEKVRKHVTLWKIFGTTEATVLPLYKDSQECWEYAHNNPELKGLTFRPYTDKLYEMVLVRHPSTDMHHSVFTIFPHLTEFPLNDLYAQHPTKANRWLYIGRCDDVIVLSSGEKLTSVAMEGALRDHPGVSGSLVVGQGRFSTAAIIELTADTAKKVKTSEDRARFIESLWPRAVRANEEVPAHAHLTIDKIMIAPEGKPFLRAGKGTVQRAATVELFKSEIEALYQRSEETLMSNVPTIDLQQDSELVQKDLRDIIERVTDVQLEAPDQDFFSAGMDSLDVMHLAKAFKSALAASSVASEEINARLIYNNPTLEALVDIAKNGGLSHDTRDTEMMELLHQFESELPMTAAPMKLRIPNTQQHHTVILTGSTGSLGSYLLDDLAKSSEVEKVYCLNRKSDAEVSQTKSNLSRGLTSEWGSRVHFLQADLGKPHLGLPEGAYEQLVKEATVIIHNQWQVDFNLVLPSFKPLIAGVVNLIKLASCSSHQPPIFFTSSIGTVRFWSENHPAELVPETALDDPNLPGKQGYSESKWVAERILDVAAKKSCVSSSICRVGQIAGPVDKGLKGAWNMQEWVPSLIATSKYLGMIPESLGIMDDISWTPVDRMGQILTDLVRHDSREGGTWTKYYHLENPNSCKWSLLVPLIQEHFSHANNTTQPTNGQHTTATELRSVSLKEWLSALEESSEEEGADPAKNPGLVLLGFYKGLNQSDSVAAKLDTAETCKRSDTMRSLKAVDEEWMRLWLNQWKF